MVKATRKQKGGGGFFSTPTYADKVANYSGEELTTDSLGKLLVREYPTQDKMDLIGTLNVNNNNLKEMPHIPIQNLQELHCSHNKLRVISSFPENPLFRYLSNLYPYLLELHCDNNELTELPSLPPSLRILVCNDNKLKVLPRLPRGLKKIVCHDNDFSAPFNEYVDEYNKTKNIKELKNKVNSHYSEQRRNSNNNNNNNNNNGSRRNRH